MNLRTIISAWALFLVAVLVVATPAQAASAALYVSPPSGNVGAGKVVPVQVRVNSGIDPVNAVQANITFNTSQLEYLSIDPNGTAYPLVANTKVTDGRLEMVRATNGGEAPTKGDVLFATIMFKTLTTDGTVSVVVAQGSHVVRSTDSVDIIAGSATASGPKASAANAPTPKAYATVKEASASVMAVATPAPAGSSPATTGTPVPPPSPTPESASAPVAIGFTPEQITAWAGTPWAWAVGGVILLVIIAFAATVSRNRRYGGVTPGPKIPSMTASAPPVKAGMVINPTQPTPPPAAPGPNYNDAPDDKPKA